MALRARSCGVSPDWIAELARCVLDLAYSGSAGAPSRRLVVGIAQLILKP